MIKVSRKTHKKEWTRGGKAAKRAMEKPRGRRIKRGSREDGIRGTSGTEKFKGKAKGGVERGQNRNEEISSKERLRGGL